MLRDNSKWEHKGPRLQNNSPPKLGDVVLVEEAMQPRNTWTLARVEKLNGDPGPIRSVKLRMPNGRITTRPLNRIELSTEVPGIMLGTRHFWKYFMDKAEVAPGLFVIQTAFGPVVGGESDMSPQGGRLSHSLAAVSKTSIDIMPPSNTLRTMKDDTQLAGYGANLEPHYPQITEWLLAGSVPPTVISKSTHLCSKEA
uniref:DUF5641 domain-containing protein n=1 Tax=Meloidogyne hapla TaxID=6305 RepID=A0A1I8BAB5_MELHA